MPCCTVLLIWVALLPAAAAAELVDTSAPVRWPPRLRARASGLMVLRSSRMVASCSASARFIASSCRDCSVSSFCSVSSRAAAGGPASGGVWAWLMPPSNSIVEQPAKRMPCSERFFMTSSSPGDGGLSRRSPQPVPLFRVFATYLMLAVLWMTLFSAVFAICVRNAASVFTLALIVIRL
ncbi:hypothetical protein D3C81_1635550 [compost metagenome]